MPIILGYKTGTIPTEPGSGGGVVPGGEVGLPPGNPNLGQGDVVYAIPGSDLAQPRGLEVVFEYNGLVFHDRSVRDRYFVTEIGGLDDADIRDQREVNPSDHGETTFAAYYGGRTITITGRIEATSVSKMRDMTQALRTAFLDISVEKPLLFRTNEGDRDIMILCKKAAINIPEKQVSMKANRDFMLTLRASDPRFVSRIQKSSRYISTLVGTFNDNISFASEFNVYNMSTFLVPILP